MLIYYIYDIKIEYLQHKIYLGLSDLFDHAVCNIKKTKDLSLRLDRLNFIDQ